jgi:hypothetical protein
MKTNAEVQALVPQPAPTPTPEARRPGAVTVEDVMPLLDLATAIRRRNFMTEVAKTLMVEGIDYGAIPGTGSKPTLLKPGAERLSSLFGLSAESRELASVEDWDGTGEGHGEPLFYYKILVRLTKNGILLGEGIGSCSSRESKYRYRVAERRCPKCGKAAIIRGREEYGGGWLCFARKGGCGAKFRDGDAAIESQQAGRMLNPDVPDVVNTVLKIAHKRALVAAVLLATNGSEFFTQDEEDMQVINIPSAPAGQRATRPPEPQPAKPAAPARPWRNFKGMIDEFAKLRGRLGPDYEHLYGETLQQFGVAHSNQFKAGDQAEACYRLLLERVLQVEAAAAEADQMPAEEFEPPEPEAAV